jgi:hypothetical protein
VPAALVVLATTQFRRPAVAGLLIGAAGAWMPAALGLIPLWIGFFCKRGAMRFALLALSVVAAVVWISIYWPDGMAWARSLGARRLSEAGLLASSETPRAGSFWSGVEPAYRLPVFVLYVAFVLAVSVWPVNKNLGQLLALSAAVLLASQFWYLDEGGTMVALSLPLILAVVFRPNLATLRPTPLRAGDRFDLRAA